MPFSLHVPIRPYSSAPRHARHRDRYRRRCSFSYQGRRLAARVQRHCYQNQQDRHRSSSTAHPTGSGHKRTPRPTGIFSTEWRFSPPTSHAGIPKGTKIWLVVGITDMHNGFNGLAAKVQTTLKDDPMSGHVFIFRGRSDSQVKLRWSTGDGLCLLTKRLERGRFAWPSARDGKVFLTPAQLAMLLEGIDWVRQEVA